jgi:hypothetical protein
VAEPNAHQRTEAINRRASRRVNRKKKLQRLSQHDFEVLRAQPRWGAVNVKQVDIDHWDRLPNGETLRFSVG